LLPRWIIPGLLWCVAVGVTACQPSLDQKLASPTSVVVSPSLSSIPSPVSLILAQEVYAQGETIHYQVTNQLDQTIFYLFGCGWTTPFMLENDERIGLAVIIVEEYPPTKQLAPGETHHCMWDQKVWQNPELTGLARYQSYVMPELVPPGLYELGFFYYLSETSVDSGDQAIEVWSGPFTIE
jgi:hypothetical protein